MPGWKYTMDGVGYSSMQKIADKLGRSYEWVQERVAILGRAEFTAHALNSIHLQVGGARKYQPVVFEGFGPATFEQISTEPAMCADLGRGHNFFRYRWKRAGRPATVNRALFLEAKPRDPDRPSTPVTTRSHEQENRYSDPRYLPGVPWGDLEHLSNEHNTGAARPEYDQQFHSATLGNVGIVRVCLP